MAGADGVCAPKRRWLAVICVAVFTIPSLAATPVGDSAGLELVAVMHQNLAAINAIDEALIRDDFSGVESHAEHLKSNARLMKDADLASLGLDPEKDADFDKYLRSQVESADFIANAARNKDSKSALLGVQRLFDGACVDCHADFRESDEGRTPPVLFMRSMLSSVQSINRGIVMDDYALVAREAREI